MNRREILRYTAYMTGFAVSAPVASALLVGCKQDEAVAAGEAVYQPTFFTSEEYRYIEKLADTMLPTTDTPGALDVGVPELIDKLVGQAYGPEDRKKFKNGLQKIMSKMDADNPEGFHSMDSEKSLVYLQDQDFHFKDPSNKWEDADKASKGIRNTFFDLKSLIIGTYFSTEEVATNMLAYLPVPGEYIPCGDLQELTGGKAWALS